MESKTSLLNIMLHEAVKDRDLISINRILNQNKNWIAVDNDGETVLHLAFSNKDSILDEQQKIIQILQIFLNEGININIKDRSNKTILYSAVENRLKDVIDFLINHKADLNVRDRNGNTVVHCLIEDQFKKYSNDCNTDKSLDDRQTLEHEDIEFMSHLLEKGINLDKRNDDGKTALDLAISRNLQHVMPILIRYMKDVTYLDKDGRTLIEIFFRTKECMVLEHLPITTNIYNKYYNYRYEIDIVKSLLNKEVSVDHVNSEGNTLIHIFLTRFKFDTEIIYSMLQRYTKISHQNHDGDTALHLVIKYSMIAFDKSKKSTTKFVRMLLSRGADVHLKNLARQTPVQLAIVVKHMEVLEALIEYGADLSPTINGGNLLFEVRKQAFTHNVRQKKYAAMVDILVKAGHDANEVRHDSTPLIGACSDGLAVIAQKLIENGADVHYKMKDHSTPLHIATAGFHNCQADLFRVLLNAGADIHAKTDKGETALHLALGRGYTTVKTLLELGADLEVSGKDGLLPLHKVIRDRNFKEIQVILEFGASVNDEGVLRDIRETMERFDGDEIRLRQYQNIVEILAEHWIKLKALNLPVIDGSTVYTSGDNHRQFYNECLGEVETLKEHWLDGRITLYNLLRMDVRLKSNLITNSEELTKLVKLPSLENSFPKYYTLILAQYNKAKARNPLVEPAKKAWRYLTKIDLPDICVERILAHMKNEELRLMAEEEKDINYLKRSNHVLSDDVAKKLKLI